jgi:hypothetical protein
MKNAPVCLKFDKLGDERGGEGSQQDPGLLLPQPHTLHTHPVIISTDRLPTLKVLSDQIRSA